MSRNSRVALALEGAIALRDLTCDEARAFDTAITARIDEAVRSADFSCAPVPDLTDVTPDPRRVLADLRTWRPEGPADRRTAQEA